MRFGLTLTASILATPIIGALVMLIMVLLAGLAAEGMGEHTTRFGNTLIAFVIPFLSGTIVTALFAYGLRLLGGRAYPRLAIIAPVLSSCAVTLLLLTTFFLPSVVMGDAEGTTFFVRITIATVMGYLTVFPLTKRMYFDANREMPESPEPISLP